MKKLIINFILLSLAIGFGISLFLMKQRVVGYEKELATQHRSILSNKREIHILKADWAVLTEPSRLRKLLSESSVNQIHVKQVVSADDVQLIPVPIPPPKPFQEKEDESEDEDVVP